MMTNAIIAKINSTRMKFTLIFFTANFFGEVRNNAVFGGLYLTFFNSAMVLFGEPRQNVLDIRKSSIR